jgi:hypothetical protein
MPLWTVARRSGLDKLAAAQAYAQRMPNCLKEANMTKVEAQQAADPSGWLGRILALGCLRWVSAYFLLQAKLIPPVIGDFVCLAGAAAQVAAWYMLRSRMSRIWQSMPSPRVESLGIELPLTVAADPTRVRVVRSIGWLVLLLSAFPILLFVVMPPGKSQLPAYAPIVAIIGSVMAWVVVLRFFLAKPASISLSQNELIVGGRSLVLDSQTTCSFASPGAIKITSLHGSLTFRPRTFYPGSSKYTAVIGSHLLRELAAKCSGGDAKAWLVETFPPVERDEVRARLHPLVLTALGALGVLIVLLLALALSVPHH